MEAGKRQGEGLGRSSTTMLTSHKAMLATWSWVALLLGAPSTHAAARAPSPPPSLPSSADSHDHGGVSPPPAPCCSDICPTRSTCEASGLGGGYCNCGDCGEPLCGDCDCNYYGEQCCDFTGGCDNTSPHCLTASAQTSSLVPTSPVFCPVDELPATCCDCLAYASCAVNPLGAHCGSTPPHCINSCMSYTSCAKPEHLATCDAHCDAMPASCCACSKYADCIGRDYESAPPKCSEPAAAQCQDCMPYMSCIQSGRGYGPGGKCADRITCPSSCCDCMAFAHCVANPYGLGCDRSPSHCSSCNIACMHARNDSTPRPPPRVWSSEPLRHLTRERRKRQGWSRAHALTRRHLRLAPSRTHAGGRRI